MKIVLIEKTIEHVQFKLEVETHEPNNTLAGSPTLLIDGEPHIIYSVDTLTIIKAIAITGIQGALKVWVLVI